MIKNALARKRIEKIVRGFANHRRIQIMELLAKFPGLSLMEISEELGIDFRLAGEHVRRLATPGLIDKQPNGHRVCHFLSPLGIKILKFVRTLEYKKG